MYADPKQDGASARQGATLSGNRYIRRLELLLNENRGLSRSTQIQLVIAKLLYFGIYAIFRVANKQSVINSSNFTYRKLLLSNMIVDIQGKKVYVRRGQNDIAIMNDMYESDVVNLLRKEIKPGSVVVDVGANIGKYVLIAAQEQAGLIVAVEADPENFEILKRNCTLNGISKNILFREVAISNTRGETNLYFRKTKMRNCSGLVKISEKYPMIEDRPILVRCETLDSVLLDDLGLTRIDWIIMDIEGAEVMALKGANRTLTIVSNLIIEVHTPQICQQIMEELSSHFHIKPLYFDGKISHLVLSRLSSSQNSPRQDGNN